MPSVGDNIDAYCLKCKLLLTHVVLFKVDGMVHRVKCKTCGAEHKYRHAPDAVENRQKSRRAPSTKAGFPKRTTTDLKKDLPDHQAALQWDLKMRNRPPDAPVRAYAISESYQANDIIAHPKFGVGFVGKILSDKSMSVLFCDGFKLLAMNIT